MRPDSLPRLWRYINLLLTYLLTYLLSALMDSDLAWVNGKSGRQSWRYHVDAFQRSIISEAIYHLPFYLELARLSCMLGHTALCNCIACILSFLLFVSVYYFFTLPLSYGLSAWNKDWLDWYVIDGLCLLVVCRRRTTTIVCRGRTTQSRWADLATASRPRVTPIATALRRRRCGRPTSLRSSLTRLTRRSPLPPRSQTSFAPTQVRRIGAINADYTVSQKTGQLFYGL